MKKDTVAKNDGFKTRWGFIMACIGSAVGMANIWRFPNLVATYGGLTFLIPYVLFVVLIGSTGVMEEFAFGRWAGAGPMTAFGKATQERWGKNVPGEAIGILPVIGAMGLAVGYSVVMGWIFKYTFMAFDGRLAAMGQDMDAIVSAFSTTAPEADTICGSISAVLGGAGNNLWIIIAVAVSFIIMALGVARGIEVSCKFMMPILFGLFLVLAVYIGFLPGASDGYKYILTLDPAGLLNGEVWIYAFGQAFFSLSVAGNGSVIYGAYLNKEVEIPGSARNVAVFDTIAALLAAFVIIPAMATTGAKLNAGGPGLMFIYLVNVFNGMTGARFIGIVFFLCVLFAGVSSLINLYETPVAFLQEKLHMKRVPAVAVIHTAGALIAVFIQAYASQWMDIISIYICPLGAFLAAVMFFFVLKRDTAMHAVSMGCEKPVGNWFYWIGKFIFCPLCVFCLVAGILLGGIG